MVAVGDWPLCGPNRPAQTPCQVRADLATPKRFTTFLQKATVMGVQSIRGASARFTCFLHLQA
jgi:hypothetical protein